MFIKDDNFPLSDILTKLSPSGIFGGHILSFEQTGYGTTETLHQCF